MILSIPEPNERQKMFLKARTKHIGFGGARGGGKSWAVRTKAKLLGLRYAGLRQLIVRRTYPELLNNHINILRSELNSVAKYNSTEKMFRFKNGSTINFAYCASDADLDRLQGVEYDIIYLDEATQLSEFQMKTITACLRGVNNFPKRIYYTCNPGGQGHAYIKRIFIDRNYNDGENPEEYTFIQSLVTDNKALLKTQPDYIKQLQALPPKLKAAWLYGNWDIFDGQFFDDFVIDPPVNVASEQSTTVEELKAQRKYCHVITPFDLNSGECRGWNIMRSYDFGYNKPFSLGYWAVDFDGTLYRILEMYGCTQTPNEGVKWTPDEQFKRISEFEHEHPWLKNRKIVDSVADPSIWDASRGISTAEVAAKYGIYFTPGDNERIPGWMQVHYRLQFDDNGYPRMYIFENCKAFIRTIPLMMFSETKPEDLDTTLEDHCADEVRYMCMSRPIVPIIPKKQNIIISDPLNQFENVKRG